MNIVVITESNVECYKTWSELKKYTSFKKDDFTQIGTDYVANMTDDSFTLSLDIKQLETVASQRVFTKDKFDLTNWLQFFAIILIFMLLTR